MKLDLEEVFYFINIVIFINLDIYMSKNGSLNLTNGKISERNFARFVGGMQFLLF